MECKIINDVKVFINRSTKVKNIRMQLFFIDEAYEESYVAYNLLSNVLSVATNKYDTKNKIVKHCEENYFMNYDVNIRRIYKASIFSFSTSVINGSIFNEPDLVNQAIEFLKELVFNPIILDKDKSIDFINEEKKLMIEKTKSIINNKEAYAFMRMLEKMFQGNILSYNIFSNIEALEKLNYNDLLKAYNKLFENSKIIFYITGKIDFDIEEKFSFLKNLKSKEKQLELSIPSHPERKENIYFDKMNLNQAKLFICYVFNNNLTIENDTEIEIFNDMLGGAQQSSLFQIVREENGLCYSVYSNFSTCHKAIFIYAGIDMQDYDKCLYLVKDIIKNYQDGNIDNHLLNISKERLINDNLLLSDNPFSYSANHFFEYLNDKNFNIEEKIKKIESISDSDIIRIAKNIRLDTIYCLRNGD